MQHGSAVDSGLIQVVVLHDRNETDDINRSDMDMVTLPNNQTYVVWITGNQGEGTAPNPPMSFSGAGLVYGTEQQWMESWF